MGETAKAPDWLTKEAIEKMLMDKFKENVTVVDFKLKCDIPKGSNNVCDVVRLTVTYQRQIIANSNTQQTNTTSLIIKIPKTGGMSEYITKLGIIKQEQDMYEVVLPRMLAVRQGVVGGWQLTCDSYSSPRDNVVVLEDLSASGFKMVDRQALLNYREAVLVLKTVARFHAASYKLHEEEAELVERFKEVLLNEEARRERPCYVNNTFQVAADEFSLRPETRQYGRKFSEYIERSWEVIEDLMRPKKDTFNVLNHGDLWSTNILIKYSNSRKDAGGAEAEKEEEEEEEEEEEPIDVRLIDLQIPRYNSPALDLTYFLYSSVKNEVLESSYKKLLGIYLDELNRSLVEFKVKGRLLSMESLEKAMDYFLFFALYVLIAYLPIFLCNPEDALNLKDLCEDDFKNITENNLLKKYFRAEHYSEVILTRLQHLDKRGGFDFDRVMDLVLGLEPCNGLAWCSISGKQVGKLDPSQSLHHNLSVVPLNILQTISRIRLKDTSLKRTYDYDDLAQVFVTQLPDSIQC